MKQVMIWIKQEIKESSQELVCFRLMHTNMDLKDQK